MTSLLEADSGELWVGTAAGLSCYDGRDFTTFTQEEGLADNRVTSLLEADSGELWIGTFVGLTRYDGVLFQSMLKRDGLIGNHVTGLFQDREGTFWIATTAGLTRYRFHPANPNIHIKNILADQPYGPIDEVSLPSSQSFITLEFLGISFKTRPDRLAYLYRLTGYDEKWQNTRLHRLSYQSLPIGNYLFQVKAVDRDLGYSVEPATVRINIHPPYGQIVMTSVLGLSLIGLVMAVRGMVLRRRAFLREQQARLEVQEALNQELEEELQTAHHMQMGLMPRQSPQLDGYTVAGRCVPANHVGGDFFQYYQQGEKLSVCLADVTGHAMEAAVPVMMFAGVLRTEMEYAHSVEDLFSRLNRTLNDSLGSRKFICFTLGELDLTKHTLRLSNGGCPYPYHFHAASGEVTEIQVDAYPLGIRREATYQVIELVLGPSDRVVFCSDGIMEAANETGEMFGFEQTLETIRQGCLQDISAETLIDRLLSGVRDFSGTVPQGDDQTVMVLEVDR